MMKSVNKGVIVLIIVDNELILQFCMHVFSTRLIVTFLPHVNNSLLMSEHVQVISFFPFSSRVGLTGNEKRIVIICAQEIERPSTAAKKKKGKVTQ